jgi:parallel beta-helix repeat protein
VFIGGGGSYMSAAAANTHHDITWRNNEFKDMPNGMGIQASGSSNISVIGNKMHSIGSACTPAGYCHAIYAADMTANWVISQNEIFDNAAYGIHLYGTSALPTGFTIERNLIYRNGTAGQNGAGIIVYGSGHVILNNLSHSNAYEGILMRAVSNTLVYNNTTYKNGASGISKENGIGTVCKNNLTVGDTGLEIFGCDVVGNNITTGVASSYFADPSRFNFALISGSPAVGAGANLSPVVINDYAGATRPVPCCYDVGAYQRVATSVPSAPAAPANLRVQP